MLHEYDLSEGDLALQCIASKVIRTCLIHSGNQTLHTLRLLHNINSESKHDINTQQNAKSLCRDGYVWMEQFNPECTLCTLYCAFTTVKRQGHVAPGLHRTALI